MEVPAPNPLEGKELKVEAPALNPHKFHRIPLVNNLLKHFKPMRGLCFSSLAIPTIPMAATTNINSRNPRLLFHDATPLRSIVNCDLPSWLFNNIYIYI